MSFAFGIRFTVSSDRRLVCRGGPAASYLFCLAKKGNPKKATARLALRVPALRCGTLRVTKKWEMFETRLRLRQRTFLIHFFVTRSAASRADKVKGNCDAALPIWHALFTFRIFDVTAGGQNAFGHGFEFVRLGHSTMCLGKMDQKCPLSERSEFRTFPIFPGCIVCRCEA